MYSVPGCTDSTANNFDATATTDDGSCVYSASGCTDPTACNYDAAAINDDNSCYGVLGSCPTTNLAFLTNSNSQQDHFRIIIDLDNTCYIQGPNSIGSVPNAGNPVEFTVNFHVNGGLAYHNPDQGGFTWTLTGMQKTFTATEVASWVSGGATSISVGWQVISDDGNCLITSNVIIQIGGSSSYGGYFLSI